MDEKAKKRQALGRGLGAFISTPVVANAAVKVEQNQDVIRENNIVALTPEKEVEITKIVANASQPRHDFNEEELQELSASIKLHGILQPLLVRPIDGGKYEIVAGERRYRAAKVAGLKKLPVIIKDLTDKESFELAIIENVQRDDLNPIEEAEAYQRLVDEFGLTQIEVADRVGKDRVTISNAIRLLKLPKEVLALVQDGSLSAGHAKAILAVKEPSVQKNLAKKVIDENLSVRRLEDIVSRVVVLREQKPKKVKADGSSFPEVAERLRQTFGTKVIIKHQKSGSGKIEISYFSEEELDRLIAMLCGD